MLISARSREGSSYNACVGHAVSKDLYEWELRPPLFISDTFDQIENPQIRIIDGLYYLFFSVGIGALYPHMAQTQKLDAGLYGFVANDLEGGYRPLNQNGAVVGEGERLYSIQVIPWNNSKCAALGWWQKENGEFKCRLSQPFGIELVGDKARIIEDMFL